MGGAMLDGWLDQGVSKNDVAVVEPSGEIGRPGIAVSKDFAGIPAGFTPDVVVLAVKPQMMDAALPPYAGFKDAVFLSIAAGKTIAYFEKLLGDVAVVRAMPNTPAAVRRGITAVVPNAKVSPAQRQATETLLSAVGEVAWLESENLMDAVTAVSGSGPAYVFLLAEVMAQAGIAAGLPADLADKLARATVSGSGELLHRSSDSSAQLRQNVTSPNGTTFAALQVLMDEEGMAPLMTKAVAAATTRSKELAS
jgi:pyrroline-5-carboxylate reductase